MIETVQERQRGARDFGGYYDSVCALQETCPVAAVKAHLAEGVLDVNGDRIRQQDWSPIFNSIKINKSLKFLAVRSHFQLNMDENIPEKKAKVLRSRIPAIRMKDMTAALCKALRDCLTCTDNLECLELQGVQLRESHLSLIGQGIMKNSTLKHLSLEGCRVGDCGLSLLCAAMKMAGNISTLNLTSCNLTAVGVRSLADLIKFQAMSRHNEAWKESLRYRWANFDTMIGIRRMTLNKNISISDDGAVILAESLKDDLWVKAIDLQACGLSSESIRAFLKVLKFNSTLVVLDLRRNPLIDRDLLKSVTEQVLINGYGKESEYQWLRVDDSANNFSENYDRHPRSYYDGPSRPLEPESRPVFKPAGRLRSRSASSIDRRSFDRKGEEFSQRTPRSSSRGISVPKNSKGQPWRTAVRATRYKGYPPDHVPGKSNLEEHYESTGILLPKENKPNYFLLRSISKSKKTTVSSARTHTDDEKSHSVVSPLIEGVAHHPPLPETVKELKTEIFHLRTQLDKYKDDKRDMDQKIKEIYNENSRLRNTIKLMSKSNSVIAEKSKKSSILQDEAIMDTIESSFQQFNAFLDMLRQSGFSRIVTAAGMDNFASSRQMMDKISLPRGDPPNLSSGTSVSSIKHLDVISNGSGISPGIDKRKAICNENTSKSGYSNKFEKSQLKGSKNGEEALCSPVTRGDTIEDLGPRFRELEDNIDLEMVGWKDDGQDNIQKLIPKYSPEHTEDNMTVEALSWKNIGKGKEKKISAMSLLEHGSGDMQEDNYFQEVGWKLNSSSKRHAIIGAGDAGDTIVERESLDNMKKCEDKYVSDDSQRSPIEISEVISKHSERKTDNYKVIRSHEFLSPDMHVEDVESSTDDSENGLANDPAVENLFCQQASLDAAQELSTDTSFNYGY